MISSNYDAIIAATKKTDVDLNKKSDDFLKTLTSLSNSKNPANKKSDMFELLSATVKNKVDNITNKTNSTDVISKEDLDEMLLKINSFNFVSALSSNAKKPYDKYDKYDKNKTDYSFLYNDFNLQYQELVYKHKQLENITKDINKKYLFKKYFNTNL